MTRFDEFVQTIEQNTGRQGRRTGKNIRLLCPAHDDHTPSLDVAESADGAPLVQCRSHGCTYEQVCAAIGRQPSDFAPQEQGEWTPHGPAVAVYDYTDATGKLLYQVLRTADKQFPQRQPDPTAKSGWRWNLEGVARVLYRLPRVLDAVAVGETVYVVEGEKDVHAIERAGGVATCNPGGAGKWRSEYASALAGAHIVVIADRDAVGREHSLRVAASLPDAAATVRQPAVGKDAYDHLAAGRTLAELVPLEDDASPDAAVEAHSWTPVDLILTSATPPEPPTIGGIVYPGRRHLFSGEPEALKSWAAMILCVEQMQNGHTVAYIDFEMGGRETLSRLRDLGVGDADLTERFIYIEPDESFLDQTIRSDTDQLLQDRHPTIIIIDAFTGALQIHALDPNKSIDIETFYRNVVDPLRAYGAAVVVLDHLAKDTTTRGRFAIGSERKVGAAEVHLGFEVIVPFARGRTGRAKITTHKDRPGFLPRPRAAELELASAPATGRITWRMLAAEQKEETGVPFRPTHLMEKVSRYLELLHEPADAGDVERNVTGKGEYVRKAVDWLVVEAFVTEDSGPRGARLFTVIKPYREADDPISNDLVPTSSHLVPDEVEESPSTSSPPYRGTGSSRDEVNHLNGHHLVPDGLTLETASENGHNNEHEEDENERNAYLASLPEEVDEP